MKEFFQSVKQKWENIWLPKIQTKTEIEVERDKTYETRWVWYHAVIAISCLVTNILLLWMLILLREL